ncbi:hypothetical protein A1O1_05221 [Capronia coronata CBS 617.96]|uniref:U6 snRNA phosphodiesterase n=1 Tax=Capronia coronata CBS 617.96 TaxID=1182541 RepID=W9YG99_9EURO|nr:uncharacterized protein A1O1_05221 [Capronia coronata CBS 617.96]EXJ88291.1 hypothetical protein A1O1_05221 [Capronia coronata CBS 617.96]
MLVDYTDSESDSNSISDAGQTEKCNHDKQNGSGDRTRKRKAQGEQGDRDTEPVRAKVKSKPPPQLPSSFHSLYATNVRTSATDDPSLHAGRTRQVPHVVGNWPTHVYLEWSPSKSEVEILDKLLKSAEAALQSMSSHSIQDVKLHSFLRSELGALLPLHVSLSAPLVLKTEQKTVFQQSLVNKVTNSHLKLKPFTVEVVGLDWVANQDRSRSFLVLRLSRPENDELNTLLSACNGIARQFQVPTLYDDADDGISKRSRRNVDRSGAFHISIAWTLQVPDDQKQKQQQVRDLGVDEWRGLKIKFSLLKLKIGSSVTDIPFVKR